MISNFTFGRLSALGAITVFLVCSPLNLHAHDGINTDVIHTSKTIYTRGSISREDTETYTIETNCICVKEEDCPCSGYGGIKVPDIFKEIPLSEVRVPKSDVLRISKDEFLVSVGEEAILTQK